MAWVGCGSAPRGIESVAQAAEVAKKSEAELRYFGIVAASAAFGLAIAAIGGAFSQSRGIRSALEGIARNPGASGPITTTMIIGLALDRVLGDLCARGMLDPAHRESVRHLDVHRLIRA